MPKTVLVVDDSATIREAVRHALTGEDWIVREATDAAEALAVLRSDAPDAVLCDVTLPDGDGYETCKTLRGAAGTPLPVILMGTRVSHAAALAAGAAATLTKPFEAAEVAETLHAAVEESSFSLDFGELEAEGDAPLTLSEVVRELPGAGKAVEGVEIIDLSADDDFADLELLEDLEPIGPVRPASTPPKVPSGDLLGPDDDPFADLFPTDPRVAEEARGPATAAPGFDLDLADLFGEPVTPPPGPQEPPEEEIPLELLLEEELAPEPDGVLPDAAKGNAFEERPESYLPPDDAEGLAGPGTRPPEVPLWKDLAPLDDQGEEPAVGAPDEDLAARIAGTAERAVRQALTTTLAADRLGPLVEAVVERVVWEVVPPLAERLIREAIEKLQGAPPPPR